MLGQRRGRWTNDKRALGQRLVSAGMPHTESPDVHPMLDHCWPTVYDQCWPNVADGGPTLVTLGIG